MSLSPPLIQASAAFVGIALIIGHPNPLVANLGLSLLGFALTAWLVPVLAPHFIRIGLSGRDRSKPSRPLLAESLGAVSSLIYLFCLLVFVPFVFYKYFVTSTSGGGGRESGYEERHMGQLSSTNGHNGANNGVGAIASGIAFDLFPHQKLAEYLSALLCLQSMLILGMADDLFDIRWRNKVLLPAIAAVPLLIVYYVDFGVTKVVLPPFVLRLFDGRFAGRSYVDLGGFYYVYMAAVAIFCPNAVNILAGVNGLEVGQCVVIAVCILSNDMLYIFGSSGPAVDTHLLSAYLLMPLLGVSLGLLWHNWWPAKVFVGDTYCYFAGMVFAVVGILGHFSKTLLLFFVPQIFNFGYSVPQLFHVIECPRHRLPKFNSETGLLEPSCTRLVSPSKLVRVLVIILAKVGLIGLYDKEPGTAAKKNENQNEGNHNEQKAVEGHNESGEVIYISNMTLMNLMLVRLGPMREDHLTMVMLGIQLIFGILGIVLRHSVAALIFGRDNY